MSYSIDLRERVVKFVSEGGSKAEAQRVFKVSKWCVNDWCKREDLEPKSPPGRNRKLDWEALSRDVKENPDKLLRERKEQIGGAVSSLWYACRKMGITAKKNTSL